MSISLTPAYGRDYKSKASALVDFHSGKDFYISDVFHGAAGKSTNKFDLVAMGETSAVIRYDNLKKQTVVKL